MEEGHMRGLRCREGRAAVPSSGRASSWSPPLDSTEGGPSSGAEQRAGQQLVSTSGQRGTQHWPAPGTHTLNVITQRSWGADKMASGDQGHVQQSLASARSGFQQGLLGSGLGGRAPRGYSAFRDEGNGEERGDGERGGGVDAQESAAATAGPPSPSALGQARRRSPSLSDLIAVPGVYHLPSPPAHSQPHSPWQRQAAKQNDMLTDGGGVVTSELGPMQFRLLTICCLAAVAHAAATYASAFVAMSATQEGELVMSARAPSQAGCGTVTPRAGVLAQVGLQT
ncbi:hypothetical protein T492DRAFT_843552 [Pavlovales sp. CCMP2436]|nr:hypothetical protein T492DRAFT_843552 [Pavlovales sp. CCMP2436]